jgi:methyl-accepting chemotaxis protein
VRADDGAESPYVQAEVATSAEQLRRLIEEQADELAKAESALREITAICDLAEWASDTADSSAPTVVLVDDLRRVLTARRGSESGT